MSQPAEFNVNDYFEERFNASESGSVIYDLELHDTIYQQITKPRGVRISDAFGAMAPDGGGGVKEHDVNLTIACFVRVEGKDKQARRMASQAVFEISEEIYGLLFDDQTLGGRVCDSVPGQFTRSYDVLDAKPYAVVNIPLVINPS